jgi:hypothetical protein
VAAIECMPPHQVCFREEHAHTHSSNLYSNKYRDRQLFPAMLGTVLQLWQAQYE